MYMPFDKLSLNISTQGILLAFGCLVAHHERGFILAKASRMVGGRGVSAFTFSFGGPAEINLFMETGNL